MNKSKRKKTGTVKLDLTKLGDIYDIVKVKLVGLKGFQIVMTVEGHMLKK